MDSVFDCKSEGSGSDPGARCSFFLLYKYIVVMKGEGLEDPTTDQMSGALKATVSQTNSQVGCGRRMPTDPVPAHLTGNRKQETDEEASQQVAARWGPTAVIHSHEAIV